ncbi:MAG: chitobiase/beta-hexosaminidase C-terminal domain-containing protein [Bacteroidaceae bacterium]|nr:chitobiase/beta-hexosaminidase C-terminal domain-containing protein [Bacteroidaceae bacterium]
MAEIFEYRGISDLVYAKVTEDSSDAYVTGEVKSLAGVAELGRTTETSNEAHYYDNMPAVVISSTGSDEVTITCSAIPLDVLADITGQVYDPTTGAMIEGSRDVQYFAIGYKTKKTNGDEVYVWRYKGTFSIPDSTHATEDDGTDANGQEITFTGIQTTHKFTKNNNKGAKALNVDVGLGLADVSDFFEEVTTPDDLEAVTPTETVATPTASPASGAIASGTSVALSCSTTGAAIYYTTDGTVPTSASTRYTSAINITTGTTIKAIAIKAGMNNSSVGTFTYTISG